MKTSTDEVKEFISQFPELEAFFASEDQSEWEKCGFKSCYPIDRRHSIEFRDRWFDIVNIIALAAALGKTKHLHYLLFGKNYQYNHWLLEDENQALRLAAKYGRTKTLCMLLHYYPTAPKERKLKSSEDLIEQICAYNHAVFHAAVIGGHVEVVKELLEYEKVNANMARSKNAPLYAALVYGHEEIVKELLSHQAVRDELEFMSKGALTFAKNKFSVEIVNEFITHPAFFEEAERSTGFDGIIWDFIVERINVLPKEIGHFLPKKSGEHYDVDLQQATLYFYMIRHLIRFSDTEYMQMVSPAIIEHLLMIPAVRALAHQSVRKGPINELLLCAATIGNSAVAQCLLELPDVKAIAEKNNYYQDRSRIKINLKELVGSIDTSSINTKRLPNEWQEVLQMIAYHYHPESTPAPWENKNAAFTSRDSDRYREESGIDAGWASNWPLFITTVVENIKQFEKENPNDNFDFDPDLATIMFYMIREFIRKPKTQKEQRNFAMIIEYLLMIPSVKALAHQSPNQAANELLLLAAQSGNQAAARCLMAVPKVKAIAKQSNYYRAKQNLKVDLKQLVDDNVSTIDMKLPAALQYLQVISNHYSKQPRNSNNIAEKPVQEQEAELIKQEKPIQQQEAESIKQEKPIQQQEAESIKQEKPIQQQEAESIKQEKPIQQQEAELIKQEKPIQQQEAESIKQEKPIQQQEAESIKQEKPIQQQEAESIKQEKPVPQQASASKGKNSFFKRKKSKQPEFSDLLDESYIPLKEMHRT